MINPIKDILSHFFKGVLGKPKRSDPWNRGGSLSHYRGRQKPQFMLTKHKKQILKARHASLILARQAEKKASQIAK